jgi:hypothetical protein
MRELWLKHVRQDSGRPDKRLLIRQQQQQGDLNTGFEETLLGLRQGPLPLYQQSDRSLTFFDSCASSDSRCRLWWRWAPAASVGIHNRCRQTKPECLGSLQQWHGNTK